ncbi:MAG: gliding motility-associated C-terminal domain-containing protein [Chitinophagales bacterium]|nr:gliding motility-associated C-terminal domain-containing protein [Chitinophagales bacterium]
MKKHFLFLINILLFWNIYAQISPQKTGVPPTLLCVKNASSNTISIQWEESKDKGSCFSEYGVYMSIGDKKGNYQKVSSITNANDGILVFNPQTLSDVYIFLINEQSCLNPAKTEISTSDTLSSKVPQEAPHIERVTVENNHPTIYWTPIKNPEVSDYAIFSNSNAYNIPIDTVKGRLSDSYIDNAHDASTEAGVYMIRSIEYCEDSTGLFSNITEAFNTILLTREEEDLCKRSIVLHWNGYNNHSDGVLGYRIDYKEGTGMFTVANTLASDARIYNFIGLKANAENCIRVVALLPDGNESWSNEVCLISQSVAPVYHHYIYNVTVKDDHVELTYQSDMQADVQELALERSANGSAFQVLESGVAFGNPSVNGIYTIQDFSALTSRSALYYRVIVKNACQDRFNTLPAKTILLKGENLGLNNELEWDSSSIDHDVVIEYSLYRIRGQDTLLIKSSSQEGSYTDKGVYSNHSFESTCYFIQAEHHSIDSNRTNTAFISRSNKVCLQPTPQAFIPNAFAPTGHNRIFRPILVFSSDENYLLEIFDRNGNKVFSSTDPKAGWDGTYKGKLLPFDSFTYHLEFMGMDGQEFKRVGFVTLVK